MVESLTSVVIQPSSVHRYSIIWLHGLGADGHDFEGLVPQLYLQHHAETHFIFPNAPIQPVTINGGMVMRAWYDIMEMSLQRKVDEAGIYRSAAQLTHLIDLEVAKGIAPEHILLAGFSQGGVIALHAGLRYPLRLGGILALSTYLPTAAQLAVEASKYSRDVPILMAHGTVDTVVPLGVAKAACAELQMLGYAVQWLEYPMAHSLCQKEIDDIAAFINNAFAL